MTKCSRLLINELLAFLQCELEVMDEVKLIKKCDRYFSESDIDEAKAVVYNALDLHILSGNGEHRKKSCLIDIIKLLKETDPQLLPSFVAKDLHRLPPVTFGHMDTTSLMKDIIPEHGISGIKSEYVKELAVSEIRELAELRRVFSLLQQSKQSLQQWKLLVPIKMGKFKMPKNNATHISRHNLRRASSPSLRKCVLTAIPQKKRKFSSTLVVDNSYRMKTWDDNFKTVEEGKKASNQRDGAYLTSDIMKIAPGLSFNYASRFPEETTEQDVIDFVSENGHPIEKVEKLNEFWHASLSSFKMRDLQHDNVNGFVGACIEPPNVCALSEYCTRGSLKDILENEDIKLDNMFIASLVGDIIRGLIFIHESPVLYHGALRPSNCLVDARWVVKLADFGLQEFRRGEHPPTDPTALRSHVDSLVYLAPELLRSAGWGVNSTPPEDGHPEGSQPADVYAFGLVLYELHTRKGPFGPDAPPAPTLLKQLVQTENPPCRPPLEPLADRFDCVRECCVECWAEDPNLRPDLKAVRAKLRPLRKGMKPNIFDNMIAMMEKYANNLEVLVDERTDQLQEEKKKTEALLEEMLPAPVADQLKRGKRVLPESYDSVTIYFSDIVGFTAMSAESTPLQVVDFLNDLYTCFDSILDKFDVYKVETIGDAYMVVSGLPIRNGISHAGEIASMALALLSATRVFRVRHRPEHRLLLRVGIHSGPVCAGVVGLKMPRYCLFGDTVNTASRFESTGAPLKIHCSATCKMLLDQLGGYILEERGVVQMKGKRDQVTYWLRGEEPKAAALRTQRRAQKDNSIQPPPLTERRGQRSSLKSRNWKNQIGGLHRCCSLESPKKLRFASGNHLESHTDSILHHRSDEYLMEVVGEGRLMPVQRGDLLEAPCLRHEYTSVSCPIIEHSETNPPPSPPRYRLEKPPLEKPPLEDALQMHPLPPCDIKLVINGCNYNDREAGIPLLADA